MGEKVIERLSGLLVVVMFWELITIVGGLESKRKPSHSFSESINKFEYTDNLENVIFSLINTSFIYLFIHFLTLLPYHRNLPLLIFRSIHQDHLPLQNPKPKRPFLIHTHTEVNH